MTTTLSPAIAFVPQSLREPHQPLRAIAVGWVLACPISLALSALVNWLLPSAGQPSFDAGGSLLLFLLVAFSPFVETLIMAGVLEVLLRLVRPPIAIALSSLGWGVAHSLSAPAWGLVIWWPFLIFSTLYVTWRQRSAWAAIAIVFCVHALQNLGPALYLLKQSGG